MHVYLYDPITDNSKFSKIISNIETRITDLGLNGKIIRLGVMKNVNEAVKSELRRGAKTIVVIGGDKIINQAINNLALSDVPLGIIPLEKSESGIADKLGIPSGVAACDTLSARRIERLDLAKIQDSYFLSHINFNLKGTIIEIEGKFSIETKKNTLASIINLPVEPLWFPENLNIIPNDGLLHLIVRSSGKKNIIFNQINFDSFFSFKKLKISNHNDSILLENGARISLPATVKAVPMALKVIVGKNRFF